MEGTVKIGSTDVGMLANAASPILYKKVFRKDWFKELNSAQEDEMKGIDLFTEMGFVMAMQAKKTMAQLMGLCFDDFIEWLQGFEANDLLYCVGDIAKIYHGQEQTNSAPKKEDG